MCQVVRASQYGSAVPPTPGAIWRNTTRVFVVEKSGLDVKTWMKAMRESHGPDVDIRESEDHMEVRLPIKAWFIEVLDLPALMKLIKREGKIVIDRDPHERHLEITIYDDYLE